MLKNCILNFAKLLASHDWTYHMSDSHEVWKKGTAEWNEIKTFIKNHEPIGGTLQVMLDTANPFKNGEYSN